MRRDHLADLPAVVPPPGYHFRTALPGDERAWCDIIEGSLGTGWTVDRAHAALFHHPEFDPGRLFFAVKGIEPAGTACAWFFDPDDRHLGQVHMVAVKPDHRGHRLGHWLSLLTLHYFRDHGYTAAELLTDDWRLPAIHTYLRLGFRPLHLDDSHRDRWIQVFRRLAR